MDYLFNTDTQVLIKQMKKLSPKLSNKSPKYRIEFAANVLRSGLYDSITNHDFVDQGVSGRDFDACFEMNDGNLVVHGIMGMAIKDELLEFGVRGMGEKVWDSWMATYAEIEAERTQQTCLFA